MTVISDPAGIQLAHMIALKYALKLEVKGMKRNGTSAASIAKREFGLKGSNAKVLHELEALIEFKTKQRELDFNENNQI